MLGEPQALGATPTVQAHVAPSQQTPVQGLGVQTLEGPLYTVPPGHPPTATALQAQLMLSQQTPGQGEEQVPLQVKTFGAAQPVGDWIVQAPVLKLQHLPMQGVGLQVPPQ
jgi:hypothetical protein